MNRGATSEGIGSNGHTQNMEADLAASFELLHVVRKGAEPTSSNVSDVSIHLGFEWNESVFVENMEEPLNRTCGKLNLPPPILLRRDDVTIDGRSYASFSVMLRGEDGQGMNMFINGRLSMAEGLARQDAAFVALEQLLNMKKLTIFDFIYQVVVRLRQEIE
ncbi:hypothetical protein PIB30_039588 [Stylosanthes scabra]|uniref:RNase H type-1 domain-containing protein n=1 Tax=Stylosanthes scabra TaxID=79078 RepID=A0ABU6XC06_9FABA|nr:hypothetical protein [Stylosanthes scabra]